MRAGRLHRLYPGVYSLPAPELLTQDAHLTAALLAAGPRAILARGSAAWRWQLIPAPPPTIELLTRTACRLRPDDITHDGRFPITTVPRTLLDLATHYYRRALLRALAEAEFHHDTRPADIKRTLRRGHPGSANLRAALSAPRPGPRQGRKRTGACNQELGPWTVDCLWPKHGLVVEFDGHQHPSYPRRRPRPDVVICDLLAALTCHSREASSV